MLALHNSCPCRHIFRYPDVPSHGSSPSDGDSSQDGGVGINDDVVLQNGVSGNAFDRVPFFIQREALGSQGHSLIEFHVIADDAGSAYHDSRAVVDGKMMAYLCTGMDVDACFRMSHLREDAGNKGDSQQKQFVGDAIVADGSDGGIATDDFAETSGCGVTIVGSYHIGGKDASHFGQLTDELGAQEGCRLPVRVDFQSVVLLPEAKSGLDLFGQQVEKFFHIYPDVVGDGMLVHGGVSEISGEEDGACQFHDFLQ